jgi:hypothetical protein
MNRLLDDNCKIYTLLTNATRGAVWQFASDYQNSRARISMLRRGGASAGE